MPHIYNIGGQIQMLGKAFRNLTFQCGTSMCYDLRNVTCYKENKNDSLQMQTQWCDEWNHRWKVLIVYSENDDGWNNTDQSDANSDSI